MSNLIRISLILSAAFLLPALHSHHVARSQDAARPDSLPVDVMQVLELPAQITNPTVLRSDNGYLLKCHISNSSEERILGFTYQVLVFDSSGQRMMASRTEALKLASYATEDISLQLPGKLKIKSGDQLVIAVEQVVSHQFVWDVSNGRKALQAYAKGDYLAPVVIKVLNLIDSKPRPAMIF